MAEDRKKKIQPVDMAGIGNLLEHLVAKDIITCEERDRIMQRIAKDNNLPEHTLPVLASYGRSKDEVLERLPIEIQPHRGIIISMKAICL